MKKFLLSLFVWLIWFIGFSNAWSYTFSWIINSDNWIPMFVIPQHSFSTNIVMDCYFTWYSACDWEAWQISNYNVAYFYWNYFKQQKTMNNDWDAWSIPCSDSSSVHINYDFSTFTTSYWVLRWFPYIQFSVYAPASAPYNITYSCTFNWDNIVSPWWTCPTCPICPEINTWEILSWYILASEIDINYCVWNWLCPNECWTWTDFSWDLQYSNIYINSILHPWTQNIFVNIPDYIQWDYTTTWNDFNIYVWSWYDMDYMNSIIKINSYRPDSTDFTDVFVSGLTLIFPYIFVVLLLMFIWKLLRRIFK